MLGFVFAINQSHAAVSVSISAEKLKDPGGFDMATSGILVLVADAAGDGFGGATDTSFVQADDVVLGIFDLTGGGAAGAFSGSTNVTFEGDVGEGDALGILWFPTLVADGSGIENTTPAAAVPYGMYTVSGAPPSGGDEWTLPADGTFCCD